MFFAAKDGEEILREEKCLDTNSFPSQFQYVQHF